jgi:peptidoglycan/LPS O-acetylase OafA/YrhL
VLERSFLAHADLFAFGMALAVLRVDSEDGNLRLPRGWRFGAVVLGLGLYAWTAKSTYVAEQLSYSPFNTVVAGTCALLLALVVLPARRSRQPAFLRLLETRPFVFAGLISYSVFLWHEPLIRWLRDNGATADGRDGFVLNAGLVLLVTVALSTVTYRYVEAPALRLKTFARRRQPVDVAVPAHQAQAAP